MFRIWRWKSSQSKVPGIVFTFFSQENRIPVFRTALALCGVWKLHPCFGMGGMPSLFPVLTGSGFLSQKPPGWCLPFAMTHPPNRVTGVWARFLWVAGTGLRGSKEGNVAGRPCFLMKRSDHHSFRDKPWLTTYFISVSANLASEGLWELCCCEPALDSGSWPRGENLSIPLYSPSDTQAPSTLFYLLPVIYFHPLF